MSLEAGGYISDLVAANPPGTDPKSQGDDHIRLVKAALQATFPNASKIYRFPAAVANNAGNYTVVFPDDMGKILPINAQATARTVALPTPSGANADGFRFTIIKADHSNFTVTVSGGTINGLTSLVLYQRYQKAEFFWSVADSAWYAYKEPTPPIGLLAPFGGLTAPEGDWLISSNLTIGNGSSSATALADNRTRGLFYHLWNTYSDTVCPVGSGRGASAQADFDAGKGLGLLDMRGRTWVGMDNLGGTDAGVWTVLSNGQTPGEALGTEVHTLTAAQIPAHTHDFTTGSESVNHTHGYNSYGATHAGASGGDFTALITPASQVSDAENVGHTHSGTTGNGTGAGGAHVNAQPSRFGGWIIKL